MDNSMGGRWFSTQRRDMTTQVSRYLGTREQAQAFARRIGAGLSVPDFVRVQFGGNGEPLAADASGEWYLSGFGAWVRITSSFDEVLLVEALHSRQRRSDTGRGLARIVEMGNVTGAVSVGMQGDQPLFWYSLEETAERAENVSLQQRRMIEQQLMALGYRSAGRIDKFLERREDSSLVFVGLHLLRQRDTQERAA